MALPHAQTLPIAQRGPLLFGSGYAGLGMTSDAAARVLVSHKFALALAEPGGLVVGSHDRAVLDELGMHRTITLA